MFVKNEPSSNEESSSPKSPTWVFDEQTGWIDVSDFLKKTVKLSEEMVRKTNHHAEKK